MFIVMLPWTKLNVPYSRCRLSVGRVLENRLVLLHKTEVPDVPLAMQEFQGRLLVGVGKSLRVSAVRLGVYAHTAR